MGLLSGAAAAMGNAAAANSAANAQIKSTAATNKANKELAEQQNQWNIEQWERENAYNHPAEQAKRLKDAGLSDAAAAQAVSPNSAPHLQSTNLANQQAVGSVPFPDFSPIASMNIIGIARQFEALRKESADADITETNAQWQDDIIFTEVDAKRVAARATADANTRENELHPYRLQQDYYKAKSDKEYVGYLKSQKRLAKLNIRKLDQEIEIFKRKSDKEIEVIEKQLLEFDARFKNINANTAKTEAETAKINAETENIKDANKGIKAESNMKELMSILKQTGLPDNFLGVQASKIISGQQSTNDFIYDMKIFKKSAYHLDKHLNNSPITRQWAREILNLDKNDSQLGGIVGFAETLGDRAGKAFDGYDNYSERDPIEDKK